MRSWESFGMILHAERWELLMRRPPVPSVDVSYFNFTGE